MKYFIVFKIAAVALVVVWAVATYNGFIKLKNNVEEAFATMDVYLKKRYDLIPNLVETVKGYANHESKTLEHVIKARNLAHDSTTMEDKIENEKVLQGTLRNLFALAESYPDLKANQNFLDLQAQLNEIEEDVANSRKYYNAIVKEYNNKCQMFPSNLIGKIFKFAAKPMYEVTDEIQREAIKVQF